MKSNRGRGKPQGVTTTAAKASLEELERAKRAALRRYKNYPNVIGVGSGTKFTKRQATGNYGAIQFYVRKKNARNVKNKKLPAFVYGRFKNGKINRKLRFVTDVIEVGRVRMACEAGSPVFGRIGLSRQNGRITFIFENKAGSDRHHYAISCAHVLGNIDSESGLKPRIGSACCQQVELFAQPVFSSSQVGNKVEFDIAVARVSDDCPDVGDGEIAGSSTRITQLMPAGDIEPSMTVSCLFPVSHVTSAVVQSNAGAISVQYRGGTYEVHNAWLLQADRRILEGDSGGLVHLGGTAIGILFASSDMDEGWAWFHVLEDAFDFVRGNVDVPLECFDS